MYAGDGREIIARNQAQTSDMVSTQPVVHEFGSIAVPTVLMIGGLDRTATGGNRASPEIAETLGQYPALGRQAVEAIPDATLVEFPDLGHSPQVEAPETFHPKHWMLWKLAGSSDPTAFVASEDRAARRTGYERRFGPCGNGGLPYLKTTALPGPVFPSPA